MLAYAAHRRSRRRLSPTALTLIVAGHVAVISLVAAAKMDVPILPKKPITDIFDVPLPPPPAEPPKPQPKVEPDTKLPPPPDSFLDAPKPILPLPLPQPGPAIDLGPSIGSTLPDIGNALDTPVGPTVRDDPPPAEPVRLAARSVTPADLLRPPYPDSKRRTEEEAVLRLRLSIDARGRVTAVEAVGAADPAFLAAARSHLVRHWRYRPATEDGRAVASSLTVTLRFELED